MGERIWRMPQPPPAHVISVFDYERNEWHRVAPDGLHWRDEFGMIAWDELVHACGPIREGARAV